VREVDEAVTRLESERRLPAGRTQIAILIESDYYEPEIFYYQHRFAEEQIDAHFRRVRPDTILLDEDATPLARAAVAVGRHFGAASLVVQHGAPCCRFGFAPLAADRILVWGRSSRRQLIRWGVSPEQIRITGSPRHDRLWAMFRGARRHAARTGSLPRKPGTPLRVLLLATMPPSDHRPDAVAFHLTSRTYGEMLRRAFSVLAGMPRIRLTVKLHPRAGDDPIARAELDPPRPVLVDPQAAAARVVEALDRDLGPLEFMARVLVVRAVLDRLAAGMAG
jgi:hypothetical protein